MKEIINEITWQDVREIAETTHEVAGKYEKIEMLDMSPEDFYEEVLQTIERRCCYDAED